MSNLFSSLQSAASSLRAFDRALNVVQENVTNASTPGYASQRVSLIARRFNQALGDSGGVTASNPISSRDEIAERNVRQQQSSAGFASETASQLGQLEQLYPVQGSGSIGGRIAQFFSAASQWSVQPNDTGSRQGVLDAANAAASTFRQTAAGLQQASAQNDQALKTTVAQINSLGSQIQQINKARQAEGGAGSDAGLDAQLHNTLEQLSQYTNVTALAQFDGSVTVLVGGQTPLVSGQDFHAVQLQLSNTGATVSSDSGADITATISGGSLAAQLQIRNQTLPGYTANLDQLATAFADNVNSTLSGGVDSTGTAPATALFSYTAANGVAASLSVNSLTPSQLAGSLPAAPGGNGNALNLANLSNAPLINGDTLASGYGNLAAQTGRDVVQANQNQSVQQGLVQQSQSLREQTSGVSLDQEAANMIQLQRGYEATAKMITILDQLTQTALSILPAGGA